MYSNLKRDRTLIEKLHEKYLSKNNNWQYNKPREFEKEISVGGYSETAQS